MDSLREEDVYQGIDFTAALGTHQKKEKRQPEGCRFWLIGIG